MTKKVVLLALAVLAITGTLARAALPLPCAPECGNDKDNMECADNLCCSKEGLCGLGSKYCSADAGCQSGACVENQRCGSQGGGTTCPGNQCCSYLGYCGLGVDYCGNDCQSGPCNVDNKCGKQPDGSTRECSNNLCCDKLGRCRLGGNYCSANAGCQSGACYDNKIIANQRCGSKYGNKICLNKRCCSQWGYCGHQKEYCGSGCQPKFGTCSSPSAGGLDLGAILKCTRP